MGLLYKNRLIINQRGGSLLIDNTTDSEKVKLSHKSGSNVSLTNVVTSELATNNKQTLVINDLFETVSNNKTQFVGNDLVSRIAGTVYNLNGFTTKSELDNLKSWRETYRNFASLNSQFRLQRGGMGYPNGNETPVFGKRDKNPVLKNEILSVENEFHGYTGVPIRRSNQDDVVTYAKVPDRGPQSPAAMKNPSVCDINIAGGETGSNAPGILEFTAEYSAATENGNWKPTPLHMSSSVSANWENEGVCENLDDPGCWDENGILKITSEGGDSATADTTNLGSMINSSHANALVLLEQGMGDSGDDITFTKRNKFEQVGAEFNDYPSVRIDEKGRSQPLEMITCEKGPFLNHDYAPHCEEVNNSSNFPCGNDDKVVGNRYSRTVGSGGVQVKTTGNIEWGGTTFKLGVMKAYINASHGIVLASETGLDFQSLKTIALRTNRQVYVENALGVKHNITAGGGMSLEGELYCQHVTAPLEVQETEDTIVFGKFAADQDRTLLIGEAHVGDRYYPVYAKATDDLIVDYPHSHHFNNLPLRLCKRNKDVRNFAIFEGINSHERRTQALPQVHERKKANTAPSQC